MMQASVLRRMAAILAADVADFSALMEHDEVGTNVEIALLRHEIVEPILVDNRGRLIKTMDEGFIVEFGSSLESLRCGISIQCTLADTTDSLQLRIGLHLGDAIVEVSGGGFVEGGEGEACRRGPAAARGRLIFVR